MWAPLARWSLPDSGEFGGSFPSDWIVVAGGLLPFIKPPDICGPQARPLLEVMAQELAYHDSYGIWQCPIEFPMHCHMEPSQTAKGGNYPGGLATPWAISAISGDLDLDVADAGFDCPPTATLAVPHDSSGGGHGLSI